MWGRHSELRKWRLSRGLKYSSKTKSLPVHARHEDYLGTECVSSQDGRSCGSAAWLQGG